MRAITNIKTRYADYKALDSKSKAEVWKEGLINNALYIMIILAAIYTFTQNHRFLSAPSIVNIISLCGQILPLYHDLFP